MALSSFLYSYIKPFLSFSKKLTRNGDIEEEFDFEINFYLKKDQIDQFAEIYTFMAERGVSLKLERSNEHEYAVRGVAKASLLRRII